MSVAHVERLAVPGPVHPALAGFVGYLWAKSAYDWQVNFGYRSLDEQAALYAQGRDSSGQVVDPAAVVTDAPPGSSPHNYGLAVDLQPLGPKDVTIDPADFDASVAYAEKAELVDSWNSFAPPSWKLRTNLQLKERVDYAHVELVNWYTTKGSWRTGALAVVAALAVVGFLAAT